MNYSTTARLPPAADRRDISVTEDETPHWGTPASPEDLTMTKTGLSAKRATSMALAFVMAGLLSACALEPGRPYDLSQVNGGIKAGEAQTRHAGYSLNDEPTYYPR
jgi:hypothetical protein